MIDIESVIELDLNVFCNIDELLGYWSIIHFVLILFASIVVVIILYIY